MPLTEIDPKTALLVIDLQYGTVGLNTVHAAPEIVQRSAALAARFREKGLPVVLVNVAGGAPGRNEMPKSSSTPAPNWTELVPELQQAPDDFLVTKKRWGAFYDSPLDSYLRDNGVTQVVLAGIATSIGVESTARAAHEHGYHVTVAVDAVTDLDADAHRNSVEKVFPKLGETGTTEEVLKLLA
jgi:nicotinamidase-related amidase